MTSPYQNPFEEPDWGSQNPQHPSSFQNGHPQQGLPWQGVNQQNLPRQHQQPGYPVAVPKSKVLAAILAFFLGGLGIHDFYMGRTGRGIGKIALNLVGWLPFLGWLWFILGVWVIIDFVRILLGHGEMAHDKSGVPLT